MPRSDGSDAWGNHKSESETKRTVDLKIGEGGEEMLVCNCKLYLTLKLCAKNAFLFFFLAALSRSMFIQLLSFCV